MARTLVVGPDLVVSSLTAPATGAAGGTIDGDRHRQESGRRRRPPVRARASISRRTRSSDAGDVLLSASRAVPVLAAGATSTGTTTLDHSVLGHAPARTTSLAKADGDDNSRRDERNQQHLRAFDPDRRRPGGVCAGGSRERRRRLDDRRERHHEEPGRRRRSGIGHAVLSVGERCARRR